MAHEEARALFSRLIADAGCFGCRGEREGGLQLAIVEAEGGVTCDFTATSRYQSYPGIVHGGIVSTILDEVMAHCVAVLLGRLCVATTLRVKFVEPLRAGRSYRVRARVLDDVERDDAVHRVEAEIVDSRSEMVACASGSYLWLTAAQARKSTDFDEERLVALAPLLRQ